MPQAEYGGISGPPTAALGSGPHGRATNPSIDQEPDLSLVRALERCETSSAAASTGLAAAQSELEALHALVRGAAPSNTEWMQAVEGQLETAISFVKTLASNHQQELNLLRRKVDQHQQRLAALSAQGASTQPKEEQGASPAAMQERPCAGGGGTPGGRRSGRSTPVPASPLAAAPHLREPGVGRSPLGRHSPAVSAALPLFTGGAHAMQDAGLGSGDSAAPNAAHEAGDGEGGGGADFFAPAFVNGLRAGKRGGEHAPAAHGGGKRRADGAAGGSGAKRGPVAHDGEAGDLDPGNKRCLQCGTQETPLWRPGPAGPKTLCNACGVRYMKARRAG
ncbi:hypothetical protein WJX81_001398 [Elliptochloris bilobata]|uniref:GATA-type domain-containing protein n=1 Tax=Elliptochloris bilobata TaxID=381761 RepID=A0AAW1QK27_9CHLO